MIVSQDPIFKVPEISEETRISKIEEYKKSVQQLIQKIQETASGGATRSAVIEGLNSVVQDQTVEEKVRKIVAQAVSQILEKSEQTDISNQVILHLNTLLAKEALEQELTEFLDFYKNTILKNDTNIPYNFGTKAVEIVLRTLQSKEVKDITQVDLQSTEEVLTELKKEIKMQLDRTRIRQLQATLDFIKEQEFEGVKGCYAIDSGKPGPTLGIGIQTHGNEPVGLAVFKYYLEHEGEIKKRMIEGGGGRIIFTCNNINATEAYFKTGFSYPEVRKTRFSQVNMNRLPLDVLESKSPAYEVQRVQELRPILDQFDFGVDLHTSLVPGAYVVIEDDHSEKELCNGFTITTYVENIIKLFKGEKYLAIFDFFGGNKKIPRIIIEAGQHENAQDFSIALKNCFKICENIGMFKKQDDTPDEKIVTKRYRAIPNSLVYFPSLDYEVIRNFKMYEPVQKDTPIAINPKTGETLLAPVTGNLFMGFPKGFKPKATDQEVFSFVEEIAS